jgi:hypothetical protein
MTGGWKNRVIAVIARHRIIGGSRLMRRVAEHIPRVLLTSLRKRLFADGPLGMTIIFMSGYG